MALQKIRLGDYIVRSTLNNKDLKYGTELIVGVNNEGNIITPKGNVEGVDLLPYKIVRNGAFVYNPSRLNIGSIAQYKGDICIVSHLYIIFYLTETGKKIIDPNWLYIYFRRKEFQREVEFRNFGSQRPEFSFDKMCDIEILLPDIETQKKYVDVYLSMIENQKAYERGLDDLKLVCDAYIEDLRRKMPCEEIGPFIKREQKNIDCSINRVLGIGQAGFITPQKDPHESLKNYKILKNGDICYAPPLYNILTGALHCYTEKEKAVCSPIYEVFTCDSQKVLPEYLTLWLKRKEFIRYATFYALGVRQTFEYNLMEEVKIPIPPIYIQKSISNIYNCYMERKSINERLKNQIKDICPILIKGSIEESIKN